MYKNFNDSMRMSLDVKSALEKDSKLKKTALKKSHLNLASGNNSETEGPSLASGQKKYVKSR